jgi:tRNA-Thr(GGU) m(6)t(6)A37 methyltransferase TsaA
MDINFKSIGVIETPYLDYAPYQPVADDKGEFRIVVNPEYEKGLSALERFKYIYVLYFINKLNSEAEMTVKPSWLGSLAPAEGIGLFSSRSPLRPNPIGLSIVQIKKIEDNIIYTSGLDVFDGTPLLDIKPYIKDLDSKADANYGWLDDIKDKDHLLLHIKGVPHDY